MRGVVTLVPMERCIGYDVGRSLSDTGCTHEQANLIVCFLLSPEISPVLLILAFVLSEDR